MVVFGGQGRGLKSTSTIERSLRDPRTGFPACFQFWAAAGYPGVA
jgi:hypothetical protein